MTTMASFEWDVKPEVETILRSKEIQSLALYVQVAYRLNKFFQLAYLRACPLASINSLNLINKFIVIKLLIQPPNW